MLQGRHGTFTTWAYLISDKMIPCPVLFTATDSDCKSRSVLGKAMGRENVGEKQRENSSQTLSNIHTSHLNQCPCTILWDDEICDKGFRYSDLLWVARLSLRYNQRMYYFAPHCSPFACPFFPLGYTADAVTTRDTDSCRQGIHVLPKWSREWCLAGFNSARKMRQNQKEWKV